jgi:C4-dicarboxylate-specific signal transduction histidine kinase
MQALDPLQRMAAWWLLQGQPMAPEDWNTDTDLFGRARAGLQVVSWAEPSGRIAWSMRLGSQTEPSPPANPDAELQRCIETAARVKSTAVSRVVFTHGKGAVYACTPMRRDARLAGFVAGQYDVAELVHSVLDGEVPDDYWAVIVVDGQNIAASPEPMPGVWQEGQREARIPIANSIWTVRIAPSVTHVQTQHRLVLFFGVVISILLYVCAVMAMRARRRAVELAAVNDRLESENRERSRADARVAELNRDLERRLHDFRVLLEVLPIGIAVADDPECRRIWINRSMANMLRVPVEDNISKAAGVANQQYRLQSPRGIDVPAEDLPMQLAARTGSPVTNLELDVVRGDGSVLHTLSYSAPVFDEQGKVRGVIDACVDITERKRAEDEHKLLLHRERELQGRVERAEKYRSLALMAGGIAHDFNNLLTVIIGQSHLLASELGRHPEMARKVAEVRSAADRAAALTAQLLAFTGNVWWNAGPINLAEVIDSTRESLRERVPERVELRFQVSEHLPLIHAGMAEVQQILHHLVENAVDALGTGGGNIEIRTTEGDLSAGDIEILYPDQQLPPGHYVRLEVADTGCGIPDEIASRIFDPFFTTKFVGRGLGLSAVLGIVRAHGGGIRLDSVLHRGTRVEIVFPTGGVRGGSAKEMSPSFA